MPRQLHEYDVKRFRHLPPFLQGELLYFSHSLAHPGANNADERMDSGLLKPSFVEYAKFWIQPTNLEWEMHINKEINKWINK